MTLRFSWFTYALWLTYGGICFLVGICLLIVGSIVAGAVLLIAGSIILADAYRRMSFGEFLYIDNDRIEIHFIQLQREVLMADVDRLFFVRYEEVEQFVIKKLDGTKTPIPERFGMEEFVYAALKKYNFKLQESKELNFSNL